MFRINRSSKLFITACMLMCWACWPAMAEEPTTKPASENKIAVFRIHGMIQEKVSEFDFGFSMERPISIHELIKRLAKAQDDPNIKALVLTFERPAMGWAQMQEFRQAICNLRDADKDVYCYLEEANPGIYLLATSASRICMVPTGALNLMGIHVEQAYFKGLLDKIGLEADIEHIGDYKGAGEPFMRTEPSEQAKEMIEWLVEDLYEQLVKTIAEGRKMSADKVRATIDSGPFTAAEALENGLIDQVDHIEAFVKSLKERYGTEISFVHNYGADQGPQLDFSNMFSFFKTFGQMMSKTKASTKASIAVVYVEGMILTGKTEQGLFGESNSTGSTTIRRALNKAGRDDSIKAVVLRVNSPGGSATASEIICEAVTELKGKMPVVISMGNVAASGGYYIASNGHTIFADPGTLTGSIGVVGGKIITKGLWDWLGVSFHETMRGQNADLYNTNRQFDDRQRALVRKYMQAVYKIFTDRVIQGREKQLKKDLEQIAGGRMYTGKQALDNGLIDKLGGLAEAIESAASQANISEYEIRQLPKPKKFIDLFIQGLTGEKEDDDEVEVTATPRGWTLKTAAVRDWLPMLEQVDPQRARMVLRSLLRIELLCREQVVAVLPWEIMIR